MAEPDMERLVAELVAELRRRGVAVTVRQTLTLIEGLTATRGEHARAVARATLAVSPSDVASIDSVVDRAVSASQLVAQRDERVGKSGPAADRPSPVLGEFSAIERLRTRDIAVCTDDERAAIRRHLERIQLAGPPRRSRRWVRAASGARVDLRASIGSAARSHGELSQLRHRERRPRARRVVLLLDVSGSMEPYARTTLHLAYAGAYRGHGVEAFALGTRLTCLTRQLRGRDPDAAFVAATRAAPDWGGGTRLGSNLAALLDDPTTNGLVRGSVIVMVSDGLDRGPPDALREQMARLSRLAHRVVWVNPLRARAGYEPVAAGMAAALPFVDEFVDGHSVESFEALADVVAGHRRRGGS